jgi:hypothetical protein
MTDTELTLIAAAALIGERSTPRRDGHATELDG